MRSTALILTSPGVVSWNISYLQKDATDTGIDATGHCIEVLQENFKKQNINIFRINNCTLREEKRQKVLNLIHNFFLQKNFDHFILVYIGHGERETGNWICSDAVITYKDVLDLWRRTKTSSHYLTIISDATYASEWIKLYAHYYSENVGLIASSVVRADNGAFFEKFFQDDNAIIKAMTRDKEGPENIAKFWKISDKQVATAIPWGAFASVIGYSSDVHSDDKYVKSFVEYFERGKQNVFQLIANIDRKRTEFMKQQR